ncbi:hypothetical protein F4778DRAFT_778657 [Xylariomycetidae sp. FL2044]|nr:hypothetical protein F4778DRAFT_778657 [Xylariomycetidae sp. FL2044]
MPLYDPDKARGSRLKRLWEKGKTWNATALSRISRRMRLVFACVLLILLTISLSLPHLREVDIPRLHLEYADDSSSNAVTTTTPTSASSSSFTSSSASSSSPWAPSPYNETKVALLIENRALPSLAPLLLHFISVVPPDWRFRFMGSEASVAQVGKSPAIRSQVSGGKLDLTLIPSNMSTGGQEEISQFLTTLWVYETLLRPAETLLVFQTDSVLCANSARSLDDYLDYDWVGAPWNPSGRFGGNGGLSLRKVGAIVEVLREQVRAPGSEPEDVWLTERLGHRPGAKMANGTLSLTFSGEMHPGDKTSVDKTTTTTTNKGGGNNNGDGDGNAAAAASSSSGGYVSGIDDWRDGFYEPMGYHTGGSGRWLHGGIWGTPELRKHIWDYCPEVKMTLAMDAARYVPGDCGSHWEQQPQKKKKRGPDGDADGEGAGIDGDPDLGYYYGTEILDGVEYPILPGLVPW